MHHRLFNLGCGADAYLDASDDADGTPVLDADIEAILFLRSGNVSMTKSRNSNNAPTSFCNSCKCSKIKAKKKLIILFEFFVSY